MATYQEQIETAWSGLRKQDHGLEGISPLRLTATSDTGVLTAEFAHVESLACSLLSLRFRYDAPIDIQAVAEQLAPRLHYLLEPIRLVEIDHELEVAQLRSDPPLKQGARRGYYEIVARPDEIILNRYEKTSGSPRAVKPASLTREVFLRIADDLTDIVAEAASKRTVDQRHG